MDWEGRVEWEGGLGGKAGVLVGLKMVLAVILRFTNTPQETA